MGRAANEEQNEDQKESSEWISRGHHLVFFLAYVMSYSAGTSVLLDDENDSKNHEDRKNLQFIIIAIFIGGPVLFFQNCIGQYTRNGCLILGEIFPFLYGLGYSMLILSLWDLSGQLFYTSKLFYYTIVTICNSSPAWMKCYKNFFLFYPNCFSRTDIDHCGAQSHTNEPCFKPGAVTLSAFIFKEGIAFARLDVRLATAGGRLSQKVKSFIITVYCIFNTFIVFILLLVGASKSMKSLHTPIRMGIALCMGLLLAIGVVLFIQPGIELGLAELMDHLLKPCLFQLGSWTSSLALLIKSLKLAEGGHILFGSYVSKDEPDFWRFLILSVAFVLAVLAASVYYNLFLGLLLYKLRVHIGDVIVQSEENVIFVLFPTFLGILPSSYFFSLVYFFVLSLLNFFSMVVKVIVIEQTITTYFKMSQYSQYLRYTVCILVAAVALSMEKDTVGYACIYLQGLYEFSSIVVVSVQLTMLLVYGTQNFFDDIEYIMKVKLKTLMRCIWILTPIFCMVTVIRILSKFDFREYVLIEIIFVTVLITPIVIGFVVKFFELAVKKNLIGMLRPTNRYGPPDVEDRILRVLFNPRLMVKYRRRTEICNHLCLLNATAVGTAIQEELRQMKHFESELKFKEENKAWEMKIAAQFRKHQKYLMKALQRYKPDLRPEDI